MRGVDITPVQKARMHAAAQALARGEQKIPLMCLHCDSTSLYRDITPDEALVEKLMRDPSDETRIVCGACGKNMSLLALRKDRRTRIKAFISKGIDIPLVDE